MNREGMSDITAGIEIELHQIELRYAHTRINRPAAQRRMLQSILEYGQLKPVWVTTETQGSYVLIDGYLRVRALQMDGKDTVMALIQNETEAGALSALLSDTRQRSFEAVEEGLMLLELVNRFGLSLNAVGRRIGKDKSYVKRRIDLVCELSDEMLAVILEDRIKTWSAERVLIPLARANADHARRLCAYLIREPMSTRALIRFFDHYRKANQVVRERMIESPGLFMLTTPDQSIPAVNGPETCWKNEWAIINHSLSQLRGQIAAVFYPGQPDAARKELLAALNDVRLQFDTLGKEIERHVKSSHP